MAERILVVEDEPRVVRLVSEILRAVGFQLLLASNGQQALELVALERPDLVLLDLMLPGELDGYEVCRRIREFSTVAIIMLTARAQERDLLRGFEMGADDYLTKPFNLEELLLRVNKLINKNKKLQDKSTIGDTYSFGGNNIDFKAQEATKSNGEKIQLSKKESMLLKLLIENKNEVVPREKILQSVWGYNVYPTTRTIDNFILNFRKYFEEDSRNPKYFHSVRGVGYKYAE